MSAAELIARAAEQATVALSDPMEMLAAASALMGIALVVSSSFVKTMIPLRWLAVGSNIGFLIYGVIHPAPVILLLHATLLPINVWRAIEMVRLTRRVAAATAEGDLSGIWLAPYMRRMRLGAGTELFRKGEPASQFYFLAEGEIEFVEIGEIMQAGRMFGEIAFFTPDGRRTLTARCHADCVVLCIDEPTFRQLYVQEPAFGLQVVRLLAGRLLADRRRLEDLVGRPPPH